MESVDNFSSAQQNYVDMMKHKYAILSEKGKDQKVKLFEKQFIKPKLMPKDIKEKFDQDVKMRDYKSISDTIYRYPSWSLNQDNWWAAKSQDNPYQMPIPNLQPEYELVAGPDNECQLTLPSKEDSSVRVGNTCYYCEVVLKQRPKIPGLFKVKKMKCTKIPPNSDFKYPYFKFKNKHCNDVCAMLNSDKEDLYIVQNGVRVRGDFPQFLSRGLNSCDIIQANNDKMISFKSKDITPDRIVNHSVGVMDHVWHGSDNSKRYIRESDFISTSKNLALTTFKYTNVGQRPSVIFDLTEFGNVRYPCVKDLYVMKKSTNPLDSRNAPNAKARRDLQLTGNSTDRRYFSYNNANRLYIIPDETDFIVIPIYKSEWKQIFFWNKVYTEWPTMVHNFRRYSTRDEEVLILPPTNNTMVPFYLLYNPPPLYLERNVTTDGFEVQDQKRLNVDTVEFLLNNNRIWKDSVVFIESGLTIPTTINAREIQEMTKQFVRAPTTLVHSDEDGLKLIKADSKFNLNKHIEPEDWRQIWGQYEF